MSLNDDQLNSLRMLNEDDVVEYQSGARRSNDADGTRYDLISPIGLRRVAETCAEGAEKYDAHNWRKGVPLSVMLNHALRHVVEFLGGDRSEDHLAHAAWNLLGAMEFEETRPELDDLYDWQPSESAELSIGETLAAMDDECPCDDCTSQDGPVVCKVCGRDFEPHRVDAPPKDRGVCWSCALNAEEENQAS